MTGSAGRLAASLALALLLGLLGACGGGSGDRGVPLGTVLTTTTTGSAPTTTGGPDEAPPSSRPSSPPPPGAPAGGGSGGADPGSPVVVFGLAPAPPGTYRYDTAGTSTFALITVPYPAVSTLVVDPPSGTRQHSTRDLRNRQGTGPVIDLSLDYRSDGIYLEALTLAFGYESIPPRGQELRPPAPVVLVPTDARPGTHLEYDIPTGGTAAHLAIDIGGHEPVDVGGRGVDAIAVHTVATLPAGSVSGRVVLDARLAPSVSLWVNERLTLDATAAGGGLAIHSQYEATLQQLP